MKGHGQGHVGKWWQSEAFPWCSSVQQLNIHSFIHHTAMPGGKLRHRDIHAKPLLVLLRIDLLLAFSGSLPT